MEQQEEWLPVPEFPEYAVSNLGYVKNMLSDRMMTRSPVQYGMLTASFMRDGKQHRRSISTLVAQTFLPEPEAEHFNTPIHLDGDRGNCAADNLMWRPRSFAVNYHLERKHRVFEPWTRDIRLVNTGEVFSNPQEPAAKYGLLQREIHQSLVNGTNVFPYAFTFVYVDD